MSLSVSSHITGVFTFPVLFCPVLSCPVLFFLQILLYRCKTVCLFGTDTNKCDVIQGKWKLWFKFDSLTSLAIICQISAKKHSQYCSSGICSSCSVPFSACFFSYKFWATETTQLSKCSSFKDMIFFSFTVGNGEIFTFHSATASAYVQL